MAAVVGVGESAIFVVAVVHACVGSLEAAQQCVKVVRTEYTGRAVDVHEGALPRRGRLCREYRHRTDMCAIGLDVVIRSPQAAVRSQGDVVERVETGERSEERGHTA